MAVVELHLLQVVLLPKCYHVFRNGLLFVLELHPFLIPFSLVEYAVKSSALVLVKPPQSIQFHS